MADDPREPEELDPVNELDPEPDPNEDTEAELDPEPDPDPSDPEPEPGEDPEPEPEPRRGARGAPEARRREDRLERRITERVRREFEARAATRAPDPAEQQRQRQQLEQQRATEIDQLEAAGNYKGMAAAAARHVREDNDFRFNQLANQQRESSDRSDFRSLCRENPRVAAVADEVEQTIADLRRQGNFIATRETVADVILGRRVRTGGAAAAGQQRRRAAEGIQRERVRAPSGARSDVRTGTARRGRNFSDMSEDEMLADLTRRGG